MEGNMTTAQQVTTAKETPKKGFGAKFINFLTYGGFIIVIIVGLAIAILLDVYVF